MPDHRIARPFVMIIVLTFIAAGLAGCAGTPASSENSRPGSCFAHAAVAADHPVASAAGAEILRIGGNAVDAAVATSFTLSVVRPESCGIGGGGFMVIVDPNQTDELGRPWSTAINYRETAPAAMGPDWFVGIEDPRASRWTTHGVGVPGTVAGLLYAQSVYGVLDRRQVLQPAIDAATDGFIADAHLVAAVRGLGGHRLRHPDLAPLSDEMWAGFCRSGNLAIGDRVTNPSQARVLRRIADHGADGFYGGPVAAAILDRMQATSGPMTKDDLNSYTVRETLPVIGAFRGRTVVSMPPPSSGGIAMIQILGLLDRVLPDTIEGPADPTYIHVLAEAMKHAFADRAQWLADDAFVDVPTQRLTSDAYLDDRATLISDGVLDPYEYGSVQPVGDDSGTSHFCVIDANGLSVACTETINMGFGSCVEVPGYGFMLNNELDDFTTIPGQPNAYGLQQSDRNLPEPGKRPLSSMTPTILVRDGAVELIVGASGGPRIITGTLQCLLHAVLFDMLPEEALEAPRIHHQWMPHVLQFEEGWVEQSSMEVLESRGHAIGRRSEVGNVQMIRVVGGRIHAASDPRKGGRPAGY